MNGGTDKVTAVTHSRKESNRPRQHNQLLDSDIILECLENGTATADAALSPPSLNAGKRCEDQHFLDIIRETVQMNAEKVYASWYGINGKCNAKSDSRTFEQIWITAGIVAHHLRCKWRVKKGQRVILCYDFGLHFFEVFFGCLRAGVVAVLVYPPGPPFKKSLVKLAKVIENCEPVLILMDTKVKLGRLSDKANLLSKSRHLWPDHVEFKVTDTLPSKSGLSFDEKTDPSDLAFLQYTSGSTGDPKGCMVTFKALASNIQVIHHSFLQCYEADGCIPDEIVGFSWLPQYHDMGLVFAGIAPFVAGWRMHMMSPFTFIKNPLLWLELMSRHKVQWSIAPDFSYGLVARKLQEVQQARTPFRLAPKEKQESLPALDLSHVRFLASGAEPCRLEVKDMFGKIFSAYGLREEWYASAYGLAENVVGVTYVHGMHLCSPRQEDHSKVYVSTGKLSNLHPSLTLKVVDPDTLTEVTGDATGELWIAGPSVVAGYFGKPQLSEETFKAQLSDEPGVDFLRTGDLAFFQNGLIYICGRIKDLVIVNGVNYYPQDIEHAVQESSPVVRPGCIAAFSSEETGADGGELEIVFEVRTNNKAIAFEACQQVQAAVATNIGLAASRIVAIPARTICKTTSGKIQRRATRARLHESDFEVLAECQSISASEMVGSMTEASRNHSPSDVVSDDLDGILHGFLGARIDYDSTWEEIGLTSLMSVD